MNFFEILRAFWNFVWKSNSIWSWLVNIVLAFILIKFVFYPVLGIALGTSHPIVAVVSSSMEHGRSFDVWWSSRALCNGTSCTQAEYYSTYNISKERFLSFPFKDGFNKGDIMLLLGVEPKDIKIGDIIVFNSHRKDPIIHRVIKIWRVDGGLRFQTKGDGNLHSIDTLGLKETAIEPSMIIGRAVFRIPWLGWIKICFTYLINMIL